MTESKYFTSDVEKEKRKELKKLMNDWKKVIATKDAIVFPDDEKAYDAIEYFCADGFFPGHFDAKQKVLFIGREGRYTNPERDRVTGDLEWFKKGNPNVVSYWRRIFYMLYGIKTKGKKVYKDIPNAYDILAEMVEKNNYGFAIMNISKYVNESENGDVADYTLINRFLADSDLDKRNFIREEIELLEPDIIITANLWEGKIDENYLDKVFPKSDFANDKFSKNNSAAYYDFKLGKRTIKFIDLYHFSARGKNDKDCFYTPVMKLLFDK